MPGFPSPGPWTHIFRDLKRANRRPVVAVIAYIGTNSSRLLPLKRDDVLVCDATRATIQGGLTNAESLRAYQRRGVRIISLAGLHAKVIASPTSAWVGSANASENSRSHLIEASIRVTGEQARDLFRWATSLATAERELSKDDIARLCKLKVREAAPPSKVRQVERCLLPKVLSQLEITSVTDRTDSENRRVDAARKRLELPSQLLDFLWTSSTSPGVGDWFLMVPGSGRVSKPSQVLYRSRSGNDWIIWYRYAENAKAPHRARLVELIPKTGRDFRSFRVSERATLRDLSELFHKK
jgi:hypothetical protein